MEQGWIKLHRKMVGWEWYKNDNVFRVFFHLLLTVNYEDKKWQGIIIKVGQKITSYGHLGKELKLGVQSIRTALDKLKSTGEITIKTNNKYTIITISKWKDYQSLTGKLTNEQQTTNKQLTTTKELKELKETKEAEIMYNYENVDESGNPLKRKRIGKISRGENDFLISMGFLWRDKVASYFKMPKEDVILLNIYYPLRSVYDKEKWGKKEFEELFDFFLKDKISEESKISFDLCMSQKYVAKFKMNKKLKSIPKTLSQVSGEIKL